MSRGVHERVIMHVDMDAFFASVEQRIDPALRGRPVVVCGSGRRTVVAAASYEARPYGIRSGMPLFEAARKCPDLLVVQADIPKYVDASLRVLHVLEGFTPDVEVYSIDEAFLDVTGSLALFHGAERIARLIKEKVKQEVGLTCSVGIAPNKLLAKLASAMHKPDGLQVIRPEDVPSLLEDLPVEEQWGIGPRLGTYLREMGIRTCGQLAKIPVGILEKRFGIMGRMLYRMARGMDDAPVVPCGTGPDARSMGHSMTQDQDITGKEEIAWYVFLLAEMVGRRLRAGGYAGKTVVLTLRYTDFQTFSRRMTLKRYLATGPQIYETAMRILDGIRLKDAVRLVGVSLTNLVRGRTQIPLFEGERKGEELVLAMDRVNNRYGEFTLTWGPLLGGRKDRVVPPSWRPKDGDFKHTVP
ncbi:MAG: DNA polymerase IV [Deltaproteobacteria bacterium]|nr:DNA polymerase IV [Deltaproteobacteria bacterium]